MNLNKKFKTSKAFTLSELIIVIVLLGLVLIGAGMFLRTSSKISNKQTNEFYFQQDMRDAMLIIDEKVKKSSAVFTVPPRMFDNEDDRDTDWSYIGVPTNGINKGKVCILSYDETNSMWKENPLTSDSNDTSYNLKFEKPSASNLNSKILSYSLEGTPINEDGTLQTSLLRSLSTSTEVLSAAFVGDMSNASEEPVALAYRTGIKESPKKASLTIIVDASISMGYVMSADNEGSPSRMDTLKTALNNLIDGLAENNNEEIELNISIIDYAQFATIMGENNSTLGYNNLQDDLPKIKKIITDLSRDRKVQYLYKKKVDIMGPNAKERKDRIKSTNIADGLRLAYNTIINYSNLSGDHLKEQKYLILFMDGFPTEYVYNEKTDDYYYGDGIFNNYVSKDISTSLDRAYGALDNQFIIDTRRGYNKDGDYKLWDYYSRDCAVAQVNHFKSKLPNLKSYIVAIGVTEGRRVDSATELSMAMTGSNDYFEAENEADLNNAIEEIKKEISFDFWHLNGPKENN